MAGLARDPGPTAHRSDAARAHGVEELARFLPSRYLADDRDAEDVALRW
jgi:hypothetical protein